MSGAKSKLTRKPVIARHLCCSLWQRCLFMIARWREAATGIFLAAFASRERLSRGLGDEQLIERAVALVCQGAPIGRDRGIAAEQI